MDGFVFWMTVAILALFAFVVFATATAAAKRPGGILLMVGVVAATIFVVAIGVYAYAYAPKAFHLQDGELRIERVAGDVRIPLAVVSDVKPLDLFLGLSLKAPPGGNSGLFGIYGTFYRSQIGKFQMYSRRASRTVLLETDEGAVVVGPENRDEFIASVRRGITT